MKNIYLESEMEKILMENGYDISDGEVIDSTKVVDCAILLGFQSYVLNGEDQPLNETLIFISTATG